MADHSKWAKKASDDLKLRLKQQQQQQEAFVATRKLIEAEGPRLWAELRECLKQKCEAFNVEFGEERLMFEVVPSSTVRITTDNIHILNGSYDDSNHLATFDGTQFSVRVDQRTGRAYWSHKDSSVDQLTADQLSEMILDNFIKHE